MASTGITVIGCIRLLNWAMEETVAWPLLITSMTAFQKHAEAMRKDYRIHHGAQREVVWLENLYKLEDRRP